MRTFYAGARVTTASFEKSHEERGATTLNNCPSDDSRCLRLLIVGPGETIHVERWVRFMVAAGHSVSLFTECPMVTPPTGLKIRQLPLPRLHRLARYLLGAFTLQGTIRRIGPDIVHVQSLGTNAILALAAPRDRLVVTPWGGDVAAISSRSARRLLVGKVLKRSRWILTTSAQMRQEVIDKFGINPAFVHAISWGVDTKLFRPAHDDEERRHERLKWGLPLDGTIVFSNRSTSPVYRTLEIVQAFRSVAQTRPDIHLVLLHGRDPSNPKVRNQKLEYVRSIREAAAEIGGRVTYIEKALQVEDMASLLRAADVAVSIPYRDQRSSSVLEAISSGLVVALSDIPSNHEIQKDGATVAIIEEPLVAGLTALISNATRASDSVISTNRAFVFQHENWEAKASEVEAVYQELAGTSEV